MEEIIVYRNPMEKAFWDGVAQYPIEVAGTCVFIVMIIVGYYIIKQMWKDRVFQRKYHQVLDELRRKEKESTGD